MGKKCITRDGEKGQEKGNLLIKQSSLTPPPLFVTLFSSSSHISLSLSNEKLALPEKSADVARFFLFPLFRGKFSAGLMLYLGSDQESQSLFYLGGCEEFSPQEECGNWRRKEEQAASPNERGGKRKFLSSTENEQGEGGSVLSLGGCSRLFL